MGWWSNLFKQKAEEWIFTALTAEQVPDEFIVGETCSADDTYLEITLRSMRIVNVRVFASRFYGVVNSFINLNHLSGAVGTFQMVTTPSELQKLDAKHVDRVIPCNIPLVGPIPYRGEKVSLELGLFSVKEEDLTAPFIKLLENMSRSAGVSVLSLATPYVEPLKEGMEAITGTGDDTILNIGITTTWNPPVNGWYLVMGGPKGRVDTSSLMVTPNDFRLVDKKSQQPFKDYPYMLFTIKSKKERHDFFLLPYLKEAYQNLQKAVKEGKRTDAEELMTVFKRAALTSDDLLVDDARRIVKLVEDKARVVMNATMVAQGDDEMPPLESYPLYPKS
jgi:hypothetical protein